MGKGRAMILNPFTAPACKISRLKYTRTCLYNSKFSGPLTHPFSVLCVLMKILSHTSVKNKTERLKGFRFWKTRQKGLRVLDFALLLVVFQWHHGSEWVNAGSKNKNDLPLAVLVYLFYFILSIESAETIEEGEKQGEETEIEATSEQNGKIFITDTYSFVTDMFCDLWVHLCPWEHYWSMHAYTHSHKRETLIRNLGSLQCCCHTFTKFSVRNGAWPKMFCFDKRDFCSSLRRHLDKYWARIWLSSSRIFLHEESQEVLCWRRYDRPWWQYKWHQWVVLSESNLNLENSGANK